MLRIASEWRYGSSWRVRSFWELPLEMHQARGRTLLRNNKKTNPKHPPPSEASVLNLFSPIANSRASHSTPKLSYQPPVSALGSQSLRYIRESAHRLLIFPRELDVELILDRHHEHDEVE